MKTKNDKNIYLIAINIYMILYITVCELYEH